MIVITLIDHFDRKVVVVVINYLKIRIKNKTVASFRHNFYHACDYHIVCIVMDFQMKMKSWTMVDCDY